MLRRLSISNYLLIRDLELDLDKGLTIITGETGSGKSILIGALGLVMGDRAESGVVLDPERRCIIELEVDLSDLDLAAWFAEQELPYEARTLLRRQLDPSASGGRSRAFINDTPVRLEQLRELGQRLVHVHSQHQTLLLRTPAFQLALLDHSAGNSALLERTSEAFRTWQQLAGELSDLQEEHRKATTEQDYLLFQLNELQEARLEAGEEVHIEAELGKAEMAEETLNVLRSLSEGLADDNGAIPVIARLVQAMNRSAAVDPVIAALKDRLHSVRIELDDIATEAEAHSGSVGLDPEDAQRLRERHDRLNQLLRKHRAATTEELLTLQGDLLARTGKSVDLALRIGTLEREVDRTKDAFTALATTLSERRRKAMPMLAREVTAMLKDLGMPQATFGFHHAVAAPSATGIDRITAQFSANRDIPLAPLEKGASGGELGRVMLAMIALSAEARALPTVIFDEIDTGVSGAVAEQVGLMMERMARKGQVIAITHLPQIASKATTHLEVSKDHGAEVLHSVIRPLRGEERVKALAGMLSGRRTTKAALENARELLKGT